MARVSKSEYRKNLIFKGGLCLSKYIETGRATKDIDFLVKKLDGQIDKITTVFTEISNIDLDDLFKFPAVYTSLLTLEHKQYPGYRIKVDVSFGKMVDRLQIDIGIGDVVDEYEMDLKFIEYKNEPLLGECGTSLFAYPPEFIFSEKLQAIIELKTLNSRMKDYFDCYMLIEKNILDAKKAKEAIEKTFSKRDTRVQRIEDFSEELDPKWKLFRKKVSQSPNSIIEVIDVINTYCDKL